MNRERGIWQRRQYWEHQIRDDDDLTKHVDYIHINPVKHGYMRRAVDWLSIRIKTAMHSHDKTASRSHLKPATDSHGKTAT